MIWEIEHLRTEIKSTEKKCSSCSRRHKKGIYKGSQRVWHDWATELNWTEDPGTWSHHFWGTDGETVKTVSDFISGGSKITADGDCSHEIQRHLLLGRKVITNLDSIFKSRDKVCLAKAMFFPVVMYRCESWTIKKAECRRIDAFEQWYWRRLLRVPWTSRRSNQFILKEISPGCSLEGLTLKQTLILWPSHGKSWLIGKDPDAGRDWRQEEKGTTEDETVGWHHQLNGHEFE